MLTLLFDTSFWWDVVLLIVSAVLIFAIIKLPIGRWFILTVLGIVLIGSAVFCGVELNYYYKESGGIYGELTGFFDRNTLIVTDLSFDFENMMFTENGNADENGIIQDYSIEILSDKVIDLTRNNTYCIYVNNVPCEIQEYSTKYIIATYTYIFYDLNMNELLTDTLSLKFAFDNNSTLFHISTSGGSEAVEYWNYYFNRNSFIVDLKDISSKVDSTENSVLKDLKQVNVMIGTKVIGSTYVKAGQKISDSFINSYSQYADYGWQVNGLSVDISNYVVNENVTLSLHIPENCYSVTFYYTHNTGTYVEDGVFKVTTATEVYGVQYVEKGGLITNPPTPPDYGDIGEYSFNYWELDGVKVDLSTFIPTENIVLNAVYYYNTSVNPGYGNLG